MGSNLQFPPGFRFHPSDEELIVHYLRNKVTSHPLPASVIAEIDLYKYNPWELPSLFPHSSQKALFGEEEWYFFSPRDRKYPNGTRPNRAAASGYWKATGTDKPIRGSCGSNGIGVKKALVFYIGRPPKGVKTDWIMNEYRLTDTTLIRPSRFRGSMRLDDWVLCRVRQRGSKAKLRCQVKDCGSTETESYCTASRDGAITDYLYKDCRLLATILAGHTLWPNKTNSSASFEKSNNFNSFAAHQDDSNQVSSQVTAPPLETKPNPYTNVMVQFQDNFFTSNKPDPSIGFEELNEMAFTDRFIH